MWSRSSLLTKNGMFAHGTTTSTILASANPALSSLVVGRSLFAIQCRGVASYASPYITEAWDDSAKIEAVKPLVLSTIVPTAVPKVRAENLEEVPKPHSHKRQIHHTAKWAHASTYGPYVCAVDKIPFTCAEHGLLFRTSIAVSRAPARPVREAQRIIARELGALYSEMDEQTYKTMFELGSNKKESRSKKLIENRPEFLRILAAGEDIPIQQQSRVLEAALSPLGVIANGYGSSFCKIASAQKQRISVGALPVFMDKIMSSLEPFHVPYIKEFGSPFEKLKIENYREGVPLSPEDLLTEAHFLECIGTGADCEVPQLRSVKVVGSQRSILIHDGLNLPHFFDVSGTTGAVMQVAIGLLHKSGRGDLVDTPEKIINLGMVLAGCNFYKQGFHNFYEVLPSLNWVVYKTMKNQPYVQYTPRQLIDAVSSVLIQCMDPSDKTCHQVREVLDIVNEHALIHLKAYEAKVQGIQQQHNQAPSALTL